MSSFAFLHIQRIRSTATRTFASLKPPFPGANQASPPQPDASKVKQQPSPYSDPSYTPSRGQIRSSPHPLFSNQPSNDPRYRIGAIIIAIGLTGFLFARAVQTEAKEPAGAEKERKGGVLGITSVDGNLLADQVKLIQEKVGVWMWGSNGNRVGDPAAPANEVFREPHFVEAFNGLVLRDLKLGRGHSAAIDSKGDLLQYGGPNTSRTPVKTVVGRNLVSVALTERHVYALTSSGVLLSIPVVNEARLAKPTPTVSWLWSLLFTPQTEGVSVVGFAKGVWPERLKAVECGENHIIALSRTGKVYTVALDALGNVWGQLGNGSVGGLKGEGTEMSLSPVSSIAHIKFAQVAAGHAFNVARTINGDVFSWGSNNLGQLGIGSSSAETTAIAAPRELVLLWKKTGEKTRPADAKCTNIAAAGSTAMFVVEQPDSTQLFTVGMGQWGQLGNGIFQHMVNAPVLVPALSNLSEYSEKLKKTGPIRIADIYMSPTHAVTVLANSTYESAKKGRSIWEWMTSVGSAYESRERGEVLSWGLNDRGQLGRQDMKKGNCSVPSWIVPLVSSQAVAGGEEGVSNESGRLQVSRNRHSPHQQSFALGDGLTVLFTRSNK